MAAPGKKLAPTLPAKPATAHVRRYPRFALDARMHVRMFQDGEFKNCWGHSTEIGQDGIGATLTGTLETGEIVSLEIPLPAQSISSESAGDRALLRRPPLRLRIPHPHRKPARYDLPRLRHACQQKLTHS